ncbi:MAG: hypothetical protein AAFQ87_11585 [Bacteroidota bacterium]
MEKFLIPILSKEVDPNHLGEPLHSMEELLVLLREEEEYWEEDQHNTKLMITRIRKIYYDKWGWDKHLIRGARNIKTRYQTKVVGSPQAGSLPLRRFRNNQSSPLHRLVTYTDHDRVFGDSRVGQVPLISKSEYQVVSVPDGYFTHFAHTIGGLDAFNYPQLVTPFPPFLSFLAKLGPHADHNTDLTTWLDEIAEVCADFVFEARRTGGRPISEELQKRFILKDLSAADVVSDIDAYVIARHYDIEASKGQRVTDIFRDYYFSDGVAKSYRDRRASIFCEMVGLKNWDGVQFSNEEEWIQCYRKQLRDTTCFQVNSVTIGSFNSYWVPLLIWFNFFRKVIKTEMLLRLFIESLKAKIHEEPSPSLKLA